MKSDGELLRAYVTQRSQAAFTELVNRHVDFVYSSVIRKVGGDAHLANDAVFSVFCDLARKAPFLMLRRDLNGWLYRAAQYTAAKRVRSEHRRREVEREFSSMKDLLNPDEEPSDLDRAQGALDEALLELSARDRDVILLRFFRQRTFAEIGASLSMKEDAARKRVHRALAKLRGYFSKRAGPCTVAGLLIVLGEQRSTAAPLGIASVMAQNVFAAALPGSGSDSLLNKFVRFGVPKTAMVTGVLVTAIGTGVIFYTSHVTQASTPPAALTASVQARAVHTGLALQVVGQERFAVAKSDLPAASTSTERTMVLIALGPVVVSVEEAKDDGMPGAVLLTRYAFAKGETRTLPWNTALFITATALENLTVEADGRRLSMPGVGYTRVKLGTPTP